MTDPPPLLVARGLTRRHGDLIAVRGLSFEVGAGECLGLLGPNGAGKSTTLQLLVGQLAPDEGEALVLGLDCTRERADVMRSLGYVPDTPSWPPGLSGTHLLDFIAWSHGLRGPEQRSRVDQALARLGLADAAHRAAAGYSLGMSKRLALAAASLHEPQVYVLDEPGSALDPPGQAELDAQLRRWVDAGAAVLLCTHQVEQAERVCDRILLLRDGEQIAQGSPEELRREADAASLREAFRILMARP